MIIQNSQAFTANQTIDDVLVNNIYASNFQKLYAVTWGATLSATGVLLDLNVGPRQYTKGLRPSTQNRFPLFPDDQLGSFGVRPGDRILLQGRETAGATPTLFYSFRFRPLN